MTAKAWLVIAAALMVGGCSGAPAAPSPPATRSSTAKLTATPTLTPLPSPTPTPSPIGTAPPDPAQAENAIKRTWERFFDSSVTAAEKIKLVEDGKQYELMMEAFAADKRFKKLDAQVETVTFVSSAEAEVAFSAIRGGTTVLSRGRGRSVLQDGDWKISFKTACALTRLGADVPKAGTC